MVTFVADKLTIREAQDMKRTMNSGRTIAERPIYHYRAEKMEEW